MRLITDARPANSCFQQPPGVPLCSAETLGLFEIEAGFGLTPAELAATAPFPGLFLGSADVENCFHRFLIPPWLSRFFLVDESFSVDELGLVGTSSGGRLLARRDEVMVGCATLPMGFSWALYFAQRADFCLLERALSTTDTVAFDDRRGPPRMAPSNKERLYYYVYVDNLGVLC